MGYKSKVITTSLVGEENEVIPINEWDLDIMTSGTLAQMIHPHTIKLQEFILEDYKPTNKIILITNCSARKPYEKSKSIGGLYKYLENKGITWDKIDRAVISDLGIIPYANMNSKKGKYNHVYSFSHYAFDNECTPEDRIQFINILSERVYQFFKHFTNYQHIVALFRINSKGKISLLNAINRLQQEGNKIKLYEHPTKQCFDGLNGMQSTAYQVTNIPVKEEVVTICNDLLNNKEIEETRSYNAEEAKIIRGNKFREAIKNNIGIVKPIKTKSKEEIELKTLKNTTIQHNQDMHFHFDDRFTIEQYQEKILPLTNGCRLVIHSAQKKKWLQSLLTYGTKIGETVPSLKIGIELSIGIKKINPQIGGDMDPFEWIYSIHDYDTLQEYLNIFQYNALENKIDYICHPFSKHLGKSNELTESIIDEFIEIANKYYITVELNNRYYRNTTICELFTKKIKANCKYVYATDAHVSDLIGSYRSALIEG